MPNSKFSIDLYVLDQPVLTELQVEWDYTPQGEVCVEDLYAYRTEVDSNGHMSYDRLPRWLERLIIKHEIEEYSEEIENNVNN